MNLMNWPEFPSQNTKTSPKPQVHKPEIRIIHCMLILPQYYSTKWTMSPHLCVYSHRVYSELNTTVYILTQRCSEPKHNCAYTHTWTHHNLCVITQGSFGTQYNCACTHTRFIWNSVQLCMYSHKVHSSELTKLVCVLTQDSFGISATVHVHTHELSTTAPLLAQDPFRTQHIGTIYTDECYSDSFSL